VNIIKPYAKILAPNNKNCLFEINEGIKLLKHIEWCGRISHRSEDSITEDSWKRIIQNIVLEHGDWSIVEHASVTVEAYVDRGITHEWVRHRLFSYTQESTRFVNYEKKMGPSFVYPFPDGTEIGTIAVNEVWNEAIEQCEKSYKLMIENKCPPQIARSVFPNALASKLIITGNLRNWRHFLIMRTTKETHPQMKEVSIPLLNQFKECIPLLYDDLEPNNRQIDNLRKPR
jgi:thymidylate synthase (FAD)